MWSSTFLPTLAFRLPATYLCRRSVLRPTFQPVHNNLPPSDLRSPSPPLASTFLPTLAFRLPIEASSKTRSNLPSSLFPNLKSSSLPTCLSSTLLPLQPSSFLPPTNFPASLQLSAQFSAQFSAHSPGCPSSVPPPSYHFPRTLAHFSVSLQTSIPRIPTSVFMVSFLNPFLVPLHSYFLAFHALHAVLMVSNVVCPSSARNLLYGVPKTKPPNIKLIFLDNLC